MESEISKTILNRYATWIIGKGLKLQCQPSKETLRSEGINFDSVAFNKLVEARFGTWANSNHSSHSNMVNLHQLSREAYINSKIGGDVLTVLRYENETVTVQNIDGAHVKSSLFTQTSNGNTVSNGVERDGAGKHIAYWIEIDGKPERIEAYSKETGLRIAFLTYGNKYRIDNERGLPSIATSLETIKKTERYKEATVGSAEEVGKIAYQVVHDAVSDGTSHFQNKTASLLNADKIQTPTTTDGTQLANDFTATTGKQAINNGIGTEIKPINQGNGTLHFKEFYGTNANIICASFGIPPNVAFSLYNDSFSASRAATKDWEHTIKVERSDFQTQYYNHILAFWFHTEILKNKIQAKGYLHAFNSGNWMITESYLNVRFTGSMFPHIDPLKEVKAERAKLGELAKDLPLTTVEMSTEILNSGDSSTNIDQFAKELEHFKKVTPLPKVGA